MQKLVLAMVLLWGALPLRAQENPVTLASDPAVSATGLWDYVVPRFRLKTRIDVEVLAAGAEAELHLVPDADTPLFRDENGQVYGLDPTDPGPRAQRFADWLASDTGLNTVTAFKVDDRQVFFRVEVVEVVEIAPLTGNVAMGEQVSLAKCGRCHVVSEQNRYSGIGLTPSFRALRAIDGWQEKFELFYLANPHPSFMRVEGLGEAFDPAYPPILHPIVMTLEEIENVGAYMQSLEPLDLGAPISER